MTNTENKLEQLLDTMWKCSCNTLNQSNLLKCKKCKSDRDIEKNRSNGLNVSLNY